MRKIILVILILFQFKYAFSQVKIYILYEENYKNETPFSLTKPSDSSYIKFVHSEDMGRSYGFHYSFVEDIKDGHYQIFINDTLKRELFFRNHKKDSTDIAFFNNGKIHTIDHYNNGKRNGISKAFYDNEQLSSYAEYENDFTYFRTTYFESGKVKGRSFYLPDNSNARAEFYDENGMVIASYNGDVNSSPISEIENHFKQGKLDGIQRYVFENFLSYTIEYEMNELIQITIRNSGIVIMSKKFR